MATKQPPTSERPTTTSSDATVIHVRDDSTPAPSDAKADPARLALGPVRTNGLQRPYSTDQAIACTGHVVSAVCLYVAAGGILLKGQSDTFKGVIGLTWAMLALHVPTMILLVASWISCERIDPATDVKETLPNGWLGFKLTGPRWEKARYCAVCRKTVPGLDHHCTWLQTCVGQSNYAQFFTVACTGTIQFLSQALYTSFCLVWLDLPLDMTGHPMVVIQGVLAACLLISVPCTIMYFILLGFHVHLYFLGYGTYEWMLRRRRQQRARAAAAAAAAGNVTSANDPRKSRQSTRQESTDDRPQSRHSSSVGSGIDYESAEDKSTKTARELTAL